MEKSEVDQGTNVANRCGHVHFDEFRMYLESAERTTDRRLELTKTNASLSVLIFAGIGAIVSWSFGKPEVQPYAILIVALIGLLATIFCLWWLKQIISYKDLNNAKFSVLEEMAPSVVFTEESDKPCESFQPFKREWEIYEQILKNKSLQRFTAGKALSASISEITVPATFMASFFLILLTCIFLLTVGGFGSQLELVNGS